VLLTLGRDALNDRMILLLLDAERQTVGGTDVSLEKTPYAVRAIGKQGSWSGIVYSLFSASEAEEVIDYEIDYFGKLNRGFEWKVYSHDDPSDLLARLRLRGFAIGEEEGPNDPRFGGVAASPASTTTGRCHQRAGAGRFRNRRFPGSGSCDLGAVTYDPRVPPG
jgi:hypothetical protein